MTKNFYRNQSARSGYGYGMLHLGNRSYYSIRRSAQSTFWKS